MSGIIGVGSRSGIIGSTEIPGGYETGVWTAGFGGTTASSVANDQGYYTKIGRQVFFQYFNDGMTCGSSTGTATITGLPFTTSSDSRAYSTFTVAYNNAVDGSTSGGFVDNGATEIRFSDGGAKTYASYIDGTSKFFMISGMYFV